MAMKRIATALLAFLLVLSFPVTCLAEEPEVRGSQTITEAVEALESAEEPEAEDISEIAEDPETETDQEAVGVPEDPEEPKDTEKPGTVQEAEATQEPETAETPKEESKTAETTETPELQKEEEKQEPSEESELPDNPETPEGPQLPKEYPALDREACEEYAAFFREDAGLNNAVIAGLLANIQRESGFDPMRIGDSGEAFGLCQWNEKRQKRLDALCKRTGLNRDDTATQRVFLIAELQVYYPDTWKLLQWLADTEDDAVWAAWYICRNYEAPIHMEEELVIRQQLAKEYFLLLIDE